MARGEGLPYRAVRVSQVPRPTTTHLRTPEWGRLVFLLLFFFFFFLLVALLGQGQTRSWCLVRPPASPRAASFQDEGRTAGKGFFGHAPRRRGDGTKGWLQGTIVGRLVTVPGSGQAHRAPCVCAWPGWALQPGFPSLPFVCTPPYSPINPLLPVGYLAAWLGHPY